MTRLDREPPEVESADTSRAPGRFASWFDRALPYLTLGFCMGVVYAGRVSIGLLPGREDRMLPVLSFVFLAAGAGGWLLPALYRREGGQWDRLRRAGLALVILTPALGSAFGYRFWLTNETMRSAVAIAVGLALPATFYVFCRLAPPRRRGLWLGAAIGVGMLAGQVLVALTASLFAIYIIYTILIVGLAFLLWKGLLRSRSREAEPYPAYFVRAAAVQMRAPVALTLAAYLASCLMNGFLEARLFPVLALAGHNSALPVFVGIGIFGPVFGCLLDRDPDRNFPVIMRRWGWFCIIAPALAVLGEGGALYRVVYAVCTIGQVTLMPVVIAVLFGLGRNALEAAALGGAAVGIRVLAVYCAKLLTAIPEMGRGGMVLGATILAFTYYVLASKVYLPEGAAGNAPSPDAPPTQDAEDGLEENQPESEDSPLSNQERFLTGAELTPREREIASLVLKGVTSRAIGEELGISENTVNSHVRNLAGKFGVANRRQLLQLYVDWDKMR